MSEINCRLNKLIKSKKLLIYRDYDKDDYFGLLYFRVSNRKMCCLCDLELMYTANIKLKILTIDINNHPRKKMSSCFIAP